MNNKSERFSDDHGEYEHSFGIEKRIETYTVQVGQWIEKARSFIESGKEKLQKKLHNSGNEFQEFFESGNEILQKYKRKIFMGLIIAEVVGLSVLVGMKTENKGTSGTKNLTEKSLDSSGKNYTKIVLDGRASEKYTQRQVWTDPVAFKEYLREFSQVFLDQFTKKALEDLEARKKYAHENLQSYNDLVRKELIDPERRISAHRTIDRLKKNISDVDSSMNVLLTPRVSDAVEEVMNIDDFENHVTQYLNAYEYHDEHLRWFQEMVHSDEYKKRLLYGEGMTPGDLSVRESRGSDADYILHAGKFTGEDAHGHFSPSEDAVHLPAETYDPFWDNEPDDPVSIHEMEHKITRGDEGMSEYAKKLYTESFDTTGYKKTGNPAEDESYFQEPTERDARKKVLEYELEKLGVKKYAEEFTDDHYQKILELIKEGELSYNATDFIHMTKPEYLKQIMNTIAEAPQEKTDDESV